MNSLAAASSFLEKSFQGLADLQRLGANTASFGGVVNGTEGQIVFQGPGTKRAMLAQKFCPEIRVFCVCHPTHGLYKVYPESNIMATGSQQKKSEKLRVFSERFKSALRKSNFQDNEIAEKLRVAPSAISNWRQGLNMAKGKNLRRLAELLKCRPGWLLGEDDHEDAGMMSRAQPPHGRETWQQRALAAEKKLADLRSGLRSLLEIGGGLPRSQEKRATSSLEDHPGAAEDLEREGGLDDVRGTE